MSDAENSRDNLQHHEMSQSQTQAEMGETSAAQRAVRGGLLSGYKRRPGVFDELLTADGEMFPHYAKLLADLEAFGAAELQRRADACLRFVHEHGITYNVYGDPHGLERP